jgi:hypothetical protein
MRPDHSLSDIKDDAGLYGAAAVLQEIVLPGEQGGLPGRHGTDVPAPRASSAAISTPGSAAPATEGSALAPQSIASGAVPAWIASLNDSVIKTDMTAAAAGGTVSETGMAQLFSDLAAELTTNNTPLSASQLNDLMTIAANLNVGETASPYLTYITDALIDGNAANAEWTGGAAYAVTLGNLAVGSTATQIQELDDKWFLGSDLPSSLVQMSGDATFSVNYSVDPNPIFAAAGPSINDINQGYLGDCYLLASLAEVAAQDPSLIESMITENGNNTYGVRFFVNGTAEYVTVDNDLAYGGTAFNRATDIWASLVEQAYAQVQACGVITGNGDAFNYGNSFSTIANGGYQEYALEEITGASTITDFYGSGSAWTSYVYNDAISLQSATSGLATSQVLATIATDLADGDDVVLASRTNATDSNGFLTLVADHTMSIYGYDSSTGQLEIRNPWGTQSGQYWDTTFEVSLNTLLADGDTITTDNTNVSSPSVVIGALVSAAAGLQASITITAFTISDTAADVSAAFASLTNDTKLTSITLTDPATPAMTLTDAQFTADNSVLAKIVSPYTLTVTGAAVSAAMGLQTNADVTAFTVSDTAANVTAALSALNTDSKMTALTVSGTTSADTLNLTGSNVAATINLDGDTASARSGLTAPTLKFIGAPDVITLGTGASTIDYTLAPGGGIETIFNFTLGLDHLDINLNGAAYQVLHAVNTTYDGQHAIALYSSADPTHGVVLADVSSGLKAATLMAGHVTFGGGGAVIT